MDDHYDRRPGLGSKQLTRLLFNILTALVLLATVGLGGVYAAVFFNPQIPINPYPPPTLPPTLGLPTATNTPEITLPPLWTNTPTPPPQSSPTMTASITPSPSNTPSATTPTETPTATGSTTGPQFELQPGTPNYTSDERDSGSECKYMGIGGQVFDKDGAGLNGLTVRRGGTLAGQDLGILDTLTGSASNRFGAGGYYFELVSDGKLVASEPTVWVQVLDFASGLPLSEKVFVATFDTCDKNLILVSWKQVRP